MFRLSINQCKYQLFLNHQYIEFLYLTNLFANFYKFFECSFFNKNSKKYKETVCKEREITETFLLQTFIKQRRKLITKKINQKSH